MRKLPILIPVKPVDMNPSLALSMRSIEKNFPHSELWLGGYIPDWASDNVRKFPVRQGPSGWENVLSILGEFADDPNTPEEFWYFNDDFFVLKKITKMDQIYAGSLAARSAYLNGNYIGEYSLGAKKTLELLEKAGYEDPLNFDLHLPMIMTKQGIIDALDLFNTAEFRFWPHFRTMYGAIMKVAGVAGTDVKISGMNEGIPVGAQFVSTSPTAFHAGRVGRELRELFSIPGSYEKVFRPD